MTTPILAPNGTWFAERLPTGKWIAARYVKRGPNVHKEVMTKAGGTFARFDTEAMANLMAGKLNR